MPTTANKASIALARKLTQLKKKRDTVSGEIAAVEEQIIAHLGFDKESGSSTYLVDEGLKITIDRGVSRSVDEESLDLIRKEKLVKPSVLKSVFAVKYSVVAKALAELKELDPSTYATVAQAVTTKPRKISVAIKESK